MARFDFLSDTSDTETQRLFEVVSWDLQRYFGHTKDSAHNAIKSYYLKRQERDQDDEWGDDFYHHEGAYWVALMIHHTEDLGLKSDFHTWRVEHGYTEVPPEAGQYFYEHYFQK